MTWRAGISVVMTRIVNRQIVNFSTTSGESPQRGASFLDLLVRLQKCEGKCCGKFMYENKISHLLQYTFLNFTL